MVALEDVELQRQLVVLTVREAYTNILLAQRLTKVNQAAIQRAQLNLRAVTRAFELGLRPESDVVRAEVDVEPVAFDRDALFAESLRQRPEYRQAKLQVDATDALERQAFRNFLPDIVGGGSYGVTQFPSLNEGWTVGLSLSWTIFDGGNKVARYQESKANLEAARARVIASELDISREVEQFSLTQAQSIETQGLADYRVALYRLDRAIGRR